MDECSFIPYKAAVGKNKSGKISLKSPKNYAFKFSPIAPASINYIIIFSSRSYLQFCNYYTYFPSSYDGKNQESRLEGRQKLAYKLIISGSGQAFRQVGICLLSIWVGTGPWTSPKPYSVEYLRGI